MQIDKSRLWTLWYENEEGEVWKVDRNSLVKKEPAGFVYQHSQFPTVLRHTILRRISKDEVDNCPHPEEDIRKTYGWIDGIEGRECALCGGTQVKSIKDDWPIEWEAIGSRQVITMENSYSEDLVLAMVEKGEFTLSEAILVAANACGRCMNALAYQYGLDWGYKEGSEEWEKSNTSCSLCVPDGRKVIGKKRNIFDRVLNFVDSKIFKLGEIVKEKGGYCVRLGGEKDLRGSYLTREEAIKYFYQKAISKEDLRQIGQEIIFSLSENHDLMDIVDEYTVDELEAAIAIANRKLFCEMWEDTEERQAWIDVVRILNEAKDEILKQYQEEWRMVGVKNNRE